MSERIGDYPIGAWGAESRDYHVSVAVPPGALGEEMLAARVSVIGGTAGGRGAGAGARAGDAGPTTPHCPLRSTSASPTTPARPSWPTRSRRAWPPGTPATSRPPPRSSAARCSSRPSPATTDTAKLLARVVDVVDERTGTVRLKQDVAGVDAELANVRSVKTVRVKKA